MIEIKKIIIIRGINFDWTIELTRDFLSVRLEFRRMLSLIVECFRDGYLSRSSSLITIQTIIHRTILNGMEIYETRRPSHRAKFTVLERNERKRDKLQLVNSKQLSRNARYSIPCYVLVSQIAAVSAALPLAPLPASLPFFFIY